MTSSIHIVILAAGAGKRMRSNRPKVLQLLAGRPLLAYVIERAKTLAPASIRIVHGAGGADIKAALPDADLIWCEQPKPRGTGDALRCGLDGLPAAARVLVLYGDTPLTPAVDLEALLAAGADLAVLSAELDEPAGYGRIVRDGHGRFEAIVEERDADPTIRAIREVNTGVMTATAGDVRRWLARLTTDNAQGEYLLTDCIALAAGEGKQVIALASSAPLDCLGANDRAELARLERRLQQIRRAAALAAGIALLDPERVEIRGRLEAGRDVTIDTGVILEGDVRLGDEVTLGAGVIVRDSTLAAGTVVEPYSVLDGVHSEGPCRIGPFARLRPGTVLAAGSRVGNFVETKKTRLGKDSKANHLSYLGDAEIGAKVNIGAGTITCNYDGRDKHPTTIGAGVFIGSNSALVAPLTIGADSLVGAGSVITEDVPAASLALGRGRQVNLPCHEKKTKKKGG